MDLEKYLTTKSDLPLLKRFAHLGHTDFFTKKLAYLISIAEEEKWNQTDKYTGFENSTIFYYIVNTFDRAFKQEKIYIDKNEDHAFFNTGLMTENGDEIYGHFVKNNVGEHIQNPNYWFFKSFVKSSEREINDTCSNFPEIVTYFDDYNELYFDPSLNLEINAEHIVRDNFDRLPESFKSLPTESIITVLKGFLELTKKRIKRNNRIPVPQFYKDKIMFLIPVKTFKDDIVILAAEKYHDSKYVAHTVLEIGMAYNCARLLNKPESNWLLNKINK